MSEQQKQLAQAREVELSALCERYPNLPLAHGRRLFDRHCISCHQADGRGTKHAIPPLAGHVPSLLQAPGGTDYLANVITWGLAGTVQVQGVTYKNRMPAHGPLLRDADAAAVLAFVSTMWGNDALRHEAALVSAQQVARARTQRKRDTEVMPLRPSLPP